MFLDPNKKVHIHNHDLPHWHQEGTYIFITWRLADSVPQELIIKWKTDRQIWLEKHPKPWDSETEQDYHQTFSGEMERWLDQGMGSCHLRDRDTAQIVANCLLHDDQKLYNLDSFVIMPNHAHILLRLQDTPLEELMQTWKSVTSHRINKLLNRKGTLWQARYWDRLLRNKGHFHKTRDYIQKNPEKAYLPPTDFILWMK